jgi:uridylate kinase
MNMSARGGSQPEADQSRAGAKISSGKKELIVISLGGSLIVPDAIDVNFLKKFRRLIVSQIRNGKSFIIICGGGRTCRNYQAAAKKIVSLTEQDVDWLGIHSTKLNAHLLRTIFFKEANAKIIYDPTEKIKLSKNILIAAGWKPGWSTDYDAVMLAKTYGAKKIINLSNIDYVYDRDPRKYPDARPIKKISWTRFIAMLPSKWSPGLNSPFDPVASRLARKCGFEVIIMNGKKIKNLKKCLDGRSYIGTNIN